MAIIGQEGEDVETRVLKGFIAAVLGVELTKLGLILAVWLKQLDHGHVRILHNMLCQFLRGNRQRG